LSISWFVSTKIRIRGRHCQFQFPFIYMTDRLPPTKIAKLNLDWPLCWLHAPLFHADSSQTPAPPVSSPSPLPLTSTACPLLQPHVSSILPTFFPLFISPTTLAPKNLYLSHLSPNPSTCQLSGLSLYLRPITLNISHLSPFSHLQSYFFFQVFKENRERHPKFSQYCPILSSLENRGKSFREGTSHNSFKITFRISTRQNADAEDQGQEEACIQNRGGREERQNETRKAVQNFRQ